MIFRCKIKNYKRPRSVNRSRRIKMRENYRRNTLTRDNAGGSKRRKRFESLKILNNNDATTTTNGGFSVSRLWRRAVRSGFEDSLSLSLSFSHTLSLSIYIYLHKYGKRRHVNEKKSGPLNIWKWASRNRGSRSSRWILNAMPSWHLDDHS